MPKSFEELKIIRDKLQHKLNTTYPLLHHLKQEFRTQECKLNKSLHPKKSKLWLSIKWKVPRNITTCSRPTATSSITSWPRFKRNF